MGTEATIADPASNVPRYLCSGTNGSLPLVDISTSLGGQCVASGTFNPFSTDNQQQGLTALSVDVSSPPFPCGSSTVDTRYTDVELRLAGTLYNDNIAQFQAQGLPSAQVSYWTTLSYPLFYKLQIRPELSFSNDCPYSRQQLVDSEDDLSLIARVQTGLALITVVTTVILHFPWIFWNCTSGYVNFHKKTSTFLVKSILGIGSSLISCILIATSFYSIYRLQGMYSSLTSANCGDQTTNSMIAGYSSELTSLIWLDVLVFAWQILLSALQIRQMIVLPTNEEQRSKEFASRPTEIELVSLFSFLFFSFLFFSFHFFSFSPSVQNISLIPPSPILARARQDSLP